MISIDDVAASPNVLATHYRRFRVADRLLLTGHSHQAWPDRAERGHLDAFADAADHVDRKWDRAFAKAERVRRGLSERLDDPEGLYTLSSNTHELLVRFLSALPLRRRPRIVTTDGEFHSARRQLLRLAEEGIELVRVAAQPAESVVERLAAAVDDRTATVIVSSVFFETADIVTGLDELMAACRRCGAELLLDTYHQLNAVPMSLRRDGLERAFVVGGGYKYLQLGEGNCFLRFPADCGLRPVITGWFADFDGLETAPGDGVVSYSSDGWRFAGATYEPTSHYRAAEVFDFFDELGLTPELLREVSQHQVGLLCRLFDDLDLDPAVIRRDVTRPLERTGGFLSLTSEHAAAVHGALAERGVLTDYRRDILRLGPAPYLSDAQLEESAAILGEAVRDLAPSR